MEAPRNSGEVKKSFMTLSPDLSQCVFVIEQALSVRALQELMASGSDEAVSTGARWLKGA